MSSGTTLSLCCFNEYQKVSANCSWKSGRTATTFHASLSLRPSFTLSSRWRRGSCLQARRHRCRIRLHAGRWRVRNCITGHCRLSILNEFSRDVSRGPQTVAAGAPVGNSAVTRAVTSKLCLNINFVKLKNSLKSHFTNHNSCSNDFHFPHLPCKIAFSPRQAFLIWLLFP